MFRSFFLRCQSTDAISSKITSILNEAKSSGTFKIERIISTPQSAHITANNSKNVINFCANNYLGFSNRKELIDAAKASLDTHGYGMSSVRFICGTQDEHIALEKKIAKFHDMDDCILYPSCFDANAGIFEALLGPEDAVISDALNHASIIDGIRLCKANRYRYKHLDLVDLEKQLTDANNKVGDDKIKLIATDGVFSMDGDIAPLDKIMSIAKKFPNTFVFVDEAHSTGVMGPEGKGTSTLFENCQVDIINSTLGKAMGGATGGYTTARQDIIDLLRQKARPYLFSNSVAPSVVAASQVAFDLLEKDDQLLPHLHENVKYFRKAMFDAGFDICGHETSPIVPVMLRDEKLATDFANAMMERGIYVIGFSYPVVPKGSARIRVQISAGHSRQDLQKAVAAFIGVGKEMGVIDVFKGEAYDVMHGDIKYD